MVFLQYLYYVLSISSSTLFLMMMMMMNLVFAGSPTGLSLKLIHRDSPESPLYPGNLTQLEKMERAFQQSIDREQELTSWMKSSSWPVSRNSSSNTNSKSLDEVRPKVFLAEKLYTVEIGIGSFPNPFFYNLLMDTASDLLWLQCKGNNNSREYFKQDVPLFDWQTSRTYQPLPVNSPHPICKAHGLPAGDLCGYAVKYVDGSSTSGILATEKLTVNAVDGRSEVINNFVFGCGSRQIETTLGQNVGKNSVAGILGLGGGVGSFVDQLGGQSQKKFEYCLKPWYDNSPTTNTFLRFGSDTKIVAGGQTVQTVSIVPARGFTIYYVNMEGISVANTRVVYPDGDRVFRTKFDGTGGCIFDSGCAITQLSTQVYGPLKNQLITFFKGHNIRIRRPQDPFELCFTMPNEEFSEFPTITFHYSGVEGKGGDFVIEPYAAFTVGKKAFCLNILRSKSATPYSVVLGALQQVNHRILYDLRERKISWEYENCAASERTY